MEKQISLFDADKVRRQEAEMERLFQEWCQAPQEKLIPAGDPLRQQVQTMLRRGFGALWEQALHRCTKLPKGKYIWMNEIELPEYWVMNDDGNPCGEHIEQCPFCGADLINGGGDVVLIRADGFLWRINGYIKEDGSDEKMNQK